MNETQKTLRENRRALPRGAWILFFGTFLNKFGTFVLPFLAIYMTRQGYMGTYGLVWAVAFVFGPSLGLWLFSASHAALWVMCGALGLLAAGIVLAGPRPRAAAALAGAQ